MPFFYIWSVWTAHNKCIFEDLEPDIRTLFFNTLDLFKSYPIACTKRPPQAIGLTPKIIYPTGFFDGATTIGKGGASIILYINLSHFFHLKLGCGTNTNMREELLALWTLMNFVVSIGLPELHVYGDSNVIINWENSISRLSVLDMEHWYASITVIKNSFLSINF